MQNFQRIDWEEDVLLKEIQDMKAGRPVLGLDAGTAFDIQVAPADDSPHHPKAKRRTRAR
jgi:hypothetical protein